MTAPFYCLNWSNHKQSSNFFSSLGAQILAGAYSVDRSLLRHKCIFDIYKETTTRNFEIIVNLFGLYGPVTPLREGNYYRLRPTAFGIPDSYKKGELHSLRSVPGNTKLSDFLTKYNTASRLLINDIIVYGTLNPSLFEISHILNRG